MSERIVKLKVVKGCRECRQEYGTFPNVKEKHLPTCSRYVCPRCRVFRVAKCEVCGATTLP